jgi:hypothetical protein
MAGSSRPRDAAHWSTINQPYFRETVIPAITAARKRALKLAQTV